MNKFLEISINKIHDMYCNNGIDMMNEKIYVVWFSKTLKNAKALLSTTVVDGKYFEATYNGDKKEIYLDEYGKLSNTVLDCNDIENMFDPR